MTVSLSRPPNYTFQAVQTRAYRDFLDADDRAKITSVLAPPGYGKTILLAELHRLVEQEGHQAIWVGADANADTTTSFLVELEQRFAGQHDGIDDAFAYQQKPTLRERIDRVIEGLNVISGDIFLIVDNSDLGAPEETRRLLDALVFETPPRVRLVVSSSTAPVFDATRALLELKLKNIGAVELGFDLHDIILLLQQAGVSDTDQSLARQILVQSEGWPAAVRLLQLLTSTGGDALADGGLQAWGGDGPLDALFRRLLERLEPALQTFLIEVSVFPIFSVELLAEATQSERAASFLHYLVTNNILIVSRSGHDHWFRLHALFRRYLLRLASERLTTGRQRSVTLRGAKWLERNDQIADSLELALQINEAAMCTRLLEKLSWTLVRSVGNLASFTGWVERARRHDVPLGSEAGFWYLWTLIFERRYDDAAQELGSFAATVEHMNYSGKRHATLQAKVGLAEIVLKVHLDDMNAICSLAPGWLAKNGERERFETGAAAGALAIAQGAQMDFAAAHASALTSITSVAPSESLYGQAWAKNIWGLLELALGNPGEVDQRIQELQDCLYREIGQETLISAVTAIVRANALYHLGFTEEATAIARTCLARASDCGMLDFVWLGVEILVPDSLQDSYDTGSSGTLQEIVQRYPGRLSRLLDYRRIRLLCIEKKLDAAVQIAGRLGLWANAQCKIERPSGILPSEALWRELSLVSLMIMVGEHDRAITLVDGGLDAARRAGNRRAWIEYLLARATANGRAGHGKEAAKAFSRAVILGSESGLKSPFLENPTLIQQIIVATPLKNLGLVTESSRAFFATLTQATATDTGSGDDGRKSVSDELTRRELSLLQMLSEGKDNAQIAQDADIAVRTVKWHLRNLYSKLDVKSRTAALARARDIGLI